MFVDTQAADAPIGSEYRGETLVAIVNNVRDFAIALEQHWYRIPVTSVERRLKDRWPPQWLAFYQTKVFGADAFTVNYYARVEEIRQATRRELFPEETDEARKTKCYHQLMLAPAQQLSRPIASRRWRRIVFIPTTWHKFLAAVEINDLLDESPLEDRLWAEFRRLQIRAERQFIVESGDRRYALDFAVFCDQGQINIEADGDTWHADRSRIMLDNERDNDLTSLGWAILRFNGRQLQEAVADYCIPTILASIRRLGGLEGGGGEQYSLDHDISKGPVPRRIREAEPDYEID